jgi:hypothetical protein
MPNLNQLGLDEGAAPQIDWDAPEAGQTPPPVYPGIYTLRFKMEEKTEDWFDANEVEMVKGNPATKRKFLVVNYLPDVIASHATRDAAAVPVPNDPTTNAPVHLGPQRASFFKSDKMMISEGGELLRALGVRLEGSMLAQIEPTLQQLNGRVSFMAEVGWRAYFKSTETTITTHPRGKKRGDLPWPRSADGTPELLATNPSTGEKVYGYAYVAKIIAPHSAAA